MSDKNYICPNCNEITLHSQGDNFVCDSCEHTFTSKDTEYGGVKFIDITEFKSNEGLSESQASTAVSDETEISDDNQEPELDQEDYYYKLYANLKNIVVDIGNYFKDITDDLVKYLNDRGFFELSDKNIFIKQDSYLDHTYTSILDFSNGILDLSANVELDNDIVDDFDTIHLTMNESVIDDILDDLESKGRDNWSEADWELINHVNTEAGKFEDTQKDQIDDKILVENDTDSGDNLDNDTNLDSNILTTMDDTIDDSSIKFKYLKIEFAETSGAPSDSIIETAMDKEFTSIDDLNKILFIADSEFRNFWSQNGGVFGYDKVYISAYYEDVITNTVYELSPLLRIDLGDGKYGKDYISVKNKNIKLGAESITQFIENGSTTNHKVKIVNESKFNSKNKLILEGTRYDKQASKILSDSGLFDSETADTIIDGLFKNDIHAFVHSPNWLEKYLKGIARMCVEESNGDKNKAIKFLNDSPQVFDKYLTWVKENREKYGTKLDDEFNNKLSYKDVVDFLDKIQAELDKKSEEELANMNFSSSNYELIPIDSFEQFNSLFGGKATGDGSSDKYAGGGGTAWCHANSESTYNSSSWAGNPRHKFYVLANKDWKKIKFDPQSNSNNPKDDYGNSLIAILVDTRTGRLLNATLRCNHVGVSSNADNQYKTYSELSKIAGFNVRDAVNSDLDISIDSNTSVEDVWYKYFDGTADSVNDICEILGTSRENITEVYISDNVTIIGRHAFDGCKSLKSITIPNSVTSICGYAFDSCTRLKRVVIPDSVTYIGNFTFYGCASLTSVTIPNNVTEIGFNTFAGCTSLKNITIPNSVTTINISAFKRCISLKSITIPDSVTSIYDSAFYDCTSLTSVTIGNSVKSIDYSAFYNCTSLASVTIGNSVKIISSNAFEHCTSLTSITIPDSVTEIRYKAFAGCVSLTSVIIPDSVTSIGSYAFRGCALLTVTTNNPDVIEYCDDNDIPVKTLKENLFNSKNNLILEGTRYDKQASKILSDSGLFDSETADAIIDGLFKNDIHAFVHSPNWLEKYLKGIARMCVEESNGSRNKAIKFLNDSPQVFDKYLTWVKENRSKYGTKLDDEFINKLSYKDVVNFLNKIQAELDKKSEEELANMNFSSSNYELVPINSFEQFNSLFGGKATGDGSSNKYAGGGGTAWCHANSESTYNSSSWAGDPHHKFYVLANKDWKKIKFNSQSNSNDPKDDYGNSLIAILVDTRSGRLLNATLRCNHVGVSSNADNQYKTYSELSKIAGFNVRDAVKSDLDISIDSSMSVKDVWYKYFDGTAESVDTICEILDTSREDITEVYIPDNITRISRNAFYGCKLLTSVTIPDSVTEIGYSAFDHCTSLTNVTIPNSVTTIRSDVFYGCKSLTSVTIGNGVKIISQSAFEDCTSLTSITIPNSVTIISSNAFTNCESLTSITIPDSVTKIRYGAFDKCPSLIITTNNPYVIEYCENNNIPVKSSENAKENYNIAYSKTKKVIEESYNYDNDDDFIIEDFLPFSKYIPFTD